MHVFPFTYMLVALHACSYFCAIDDCVGGVLFNHWNSIEETDYVCIEFNTSLLQHVVNVVVNSSDEPFKK